MRRIRSSGWAKDEVSYYGALEQAFNAVFGLTGEVASALDPLRTFHCKGIIAPSSTKEYRSARLASM